MDVVIVGAGGHGKVVLDILRLRGQHRVIGFLDGDVSLEGQIVCGLPVLGSVNSLSKFKSKIKGAIVAIGDNRARLTYARKLSDAGISLISAIHPAAVVGAGAVIGANVVLAAGAVIGADANVGDSSIVNTTAVVDHECVLAQGVHICPGALLAGRVRVEVGAFVGLGAKVIQCLTVGAWSIVGAGAVVLKDISEGSTAVGVPARVIRTSEIERAA